MFLVSLAHCPRFCWQYFSLTTTFSIHFKPERCTFYCVRVLGIFFNNFSLFAENHGHFLKFWLVVGGFFCVFSQSETICILHLCYKFALVLQKNCIPFSANQNWVIFSCILSVLEYPGFEPTPLRSIRSNSEFMD